jgi:hypothetical protein
VGVVRRPSLTAVHPIDLGPGSRDFEATGDPAEGKSEAATSGGAAAGRRERLVSSAPILFNGAAFGRRGWSV